MECVTVALPDEDVDSLSDLAAREHDGDMDAAVRALLSEWLDQT